MSNATITRVRGTEDFLDLRLANFVMNQVKTHLQNYNFSEIQTPILEHTKLFVHALGNETDVVSKEMYTFQTSGEDSICLRPEATASIIRACFENRIDQFPWKVFLYGPMFRHERPQKGRWRQFSQISIEVIGSNSIAQDAHFIKMLDTLYTDILKLENYVIKLNFLGCSDDRKEHKKALVAFLDSVAGQICDTCKIRKDKNTLRVFDCKNEHDKELYTKAPKLTDYLCKTCQQEWHDLTTMLSMLSVSYLIDPMLVRGLDYYNKTVFEFSSRELGAQNAFCGGGRYNLGKEVGAKEDFPSIGVGIGIGRLLMLVETVQNKLIIPHDPPLHVIIPFTQEQHSLALLLASDLQNNHICVDLLVEGTSLSSMMKKANKMGAKHALLLGPDEQANGTVAIKNMMTGASETIKQAHAVKYLRQ